MSTQAKRRLITCSDGTWNKTENLDRGQKVETNVAKIFNSIPHLGDDGIPQLKCYDQGVGTGYTTKDKLIGGATGAGIDQNIKDVYSFLVLNYKPGDDIFLFGFSRGAYTARSLGGLINCCGILKAEHLGMIDRAYALYRNRNDYTSSESDMMVSFRDNFSHEERDIQFVGVWDTVGSLGIPLPSYKLINRQRYKFHDVTLGTHILNAYHALAIHERRRLFEPTLWERSKTVMENKDHPQKVEQRWFTGVHSNIGGGYADQGLSDIALKWLMDKANESGLTFDKKEVDKLKANANGELRNSYTSMYWFWRKVWRKVNPGNPLTNETIDESVWQRFTDQNKVPKNIRSYFSGKP